MTVLGLALSRVSTEPEKYESLQGRQYEAWTALSTGNEIYRQTLANVTVLEIQLLPALQAAFPVNQEQAPFAHLIQGLWGLQDATPVFVVGMPRSGSSLIEQILASHPDVLGAGIWLQTRKWNDQNWKRDLPWLCLHCILPSTSVHILPCLQDIPYVSSSVRNLL